MIQKIILFWLLLLVINFNSVFAENISCCVNAKNKDIDINIFGSLINDIHFPVNIDLNKNDTKFDYYAFENGLMAGHAIRAQARVGFSGKGDDWSFLITLESDMLLNRDNIDRIDYVAPAPENPKGSDFGIEKLNFTYDFGHFELSTGWDTKCLDINTGVFLFMDDHPYFGISGETEFFDYKLHYFIIDDKTEWNDGIIDDNGSDWRMYTFRGSFKISDLNIVPLYIYSDNSTADASVHYLGIETYGNTGIFTPRFEFVWAVGNKDMDNGISLDIDAFAVFASIDININKHFTPYFGGTFLSGDDDSESDTITAFNGVGNVSCVGPTFGMLHAYIYQQIPVLGSRLYANHFNMLGTAGSGYGGASNSSTGDAPGLVMMGFGFKGVIVDDLSYKTQVTAYKFHKTKGIEKAYSISQIDSFVGIEYDLNLLYKISNHFSIGNTVSIFLPQDGVSDLRGEDFDDTAIFYTLDLSWKF